MKQIVHARLQRYWDIRATGNFAFGGSGAGLILAATLGYALGMNAVLPLFVGLALIGIGLFCVWLEIGKPWRSLNVIFHPQTSWMTREALMVPPLMAAGAAALFLDIRFIWIAALFAAAFLYCQSRILFASKGIPAWCQNETVPLIIATGLAEGAGLYLAIGGVSTTLIAVALAAGIAREIAREAYRDAVVRNRAPAGTLRWFSLPEEKVLTVGRYLSIALLAVAFIGLPTAIAGGILAAVTGWGLKYMLVNRAAFTRGHVIPHTPARGHDKSHIVAPG
jgi:phenylacetyl-CoA:acceptor oxidoreductase subunit 2